MPGYELFGEEERKAVNDLFDINGGVLFAHGFETIRNGVYRVREFEAAMARRTGALYAQAVSSGTAALRVAIEALGIRPGDEIIIPAFTFVATAEAVLHSGATLVIVDVDDTYTMDPFALESAITKKTRAVIPVHMMGAPADMGRITTISSEHNISVIEDAAQAVGGTYGGRSLGTIGDLGCFSFDSGKVINTGEGGMVLTNTESNFRKARAFHDHGHEYSSNVSRGMEGAVGIGFNFRMTELQGCIGLAQLEKLNTIIDRQRNNKSLLKKRLQSTGEWKFRRILDDGEIGDTLIFRLPDRDTTKHFLSRMKARGIATKNIPDSIRWHFAKHWGHMFERYGHYASTYEIQWAKTADLLETSIALPIMVKMDQSDIEQLAANLYEISSELSL